MSSSSTSDAETAGLSTGPLWGITHVTARTGVPAATLRTWSRRYGLGASGTTDGGHRRYCEHDILRVELVVRLIAIGVATHSAIAVAAGVSPNELTTRLDALKADTKGL